MNTITINTKGDDQLKVVRAFLRALKIDFKEEKITINEIIEKGEKQIQEGKVTRIDPKNVWQSIK